MSVANSWFKAAADGGPKKEITVADLPGTFIKAPQGDLFNTTSTTTYSGEKLNVARFYEHPQYSKFGFSPYRDNDAFYNKNSAYGTDFVRAMKNFGPGFRDGFASNYNGMSTLLSGKALNPTLLDYSKGLNAERAASIAMSTKGGIAQSLVNITYNLNYTLGIAASLVAEDMALAALAPGTGGGSIGVAAARTGQGVARIGKSIYNIARGARSFDKVADARKIYNGVKSAGKTVGNLIIPETATQFGKFYRAGSQGLRFGEATKHMVSTAAGFASMYRDLRMINLAVDESGVEAVGVRNNLMDQRLSDFSAKNGRLPNQEEYDKIKKNADDAMYADYWANLPVIYLTNKLTFGNASLAPRFMKNYAQVIKTEGGSILKKAIGGKATFEGIETTLNPLKYIKNSISNRELAKANLYKTAKYFKANLGEGVQELYQSSSATTFEDYYTNLYNDSTLTGFKNYKASAKKGLSSIISQEGVEAFLGGLLGGGVVNTIGKIGRLGKEFVTKKVNPNQYENIKTNQKERLKQTIDFLNKEGENVKDFLAPDVVTLAELINDNGLAYEFADADNFKGIEDIRATSLYRKIQNLEAAGATETFINAMEQMKELTAEEKLEAFGVDTVEKADKLIDVIVDRSQKIQKNIQYVNNTFTNPYNPNEFKIGTKERNEEVIKQFAWEQAKKDLAFNLNQFVVTADRIGELYTAATSDGLAEMSNKDFSVLFNTTLTDSKKSGVNFETSLENEIGFLRSETITATSELENIKEQLKTADDQGKPALEARKKELEKSIKSKTNRAAVLLKYAAAIEKVKQSRATLKEGVERPSEEKSLIEMRKAFEEYITLIAEENKTPLNKVTLEQTWRKLLDAVDVAEDQRMASNAITILSDPSSLKKVSDLHFEAIKSRFDQQAAVSKTLASQYFSNQIINEYIEALEEIGVVIPQDQMLALTLEGTVPGKFLSTSEQDVDANGFVIEGTSLWEQIQEVSDEYEMALAETEADIESEYEEKTSTYSEKDAVKEFENTGQVSDVTIEAIALKIKNGNDLTLGEQAIYTEKSKEVEAKLKQLQKADESVSKPDTQKRIQDNQVPVKREVIRITSENGKYAEYTVTTMLDGSIKANLVSYDENGNELNTTLGVKLADNDIIQRDGLTSLDAVKLAAEEGDVVTIESTQSGMDFMNPKKLDRLSPEQKKKLGIEVTEEVAAEETSKPRNFDEQAAASQQASKETVGEEKKTKRTAPVKAKYQAAALRKELSGTEVLEKLQADFKAENTRLRKEGKSQQTFVEFINGLENIDELVLEGRDQASELSRSKSAAKKVQDFERQLKRARTVEEVDLIKVNAQMLPFIKSSDISKLDFEKRRNEIMAAAAKEEGMQNVPEPTPAQQAPEGENLDQAIETVENADAISLINDATKSKDELGGEVDINDILC